VIKKKRPKRAAAKVDPLFKKPKKYLAAFNFFYSDFAKNLPADYVKCEYGQDLLNKAGAKWNTLS